MSSSVSALGHSISTSVADAAAHPVSQLALIAFCTLWWTSGLPTDVLTATLSILAITLTQMVLNRQKLREDDDRRRDIAMHAKLDELLRAEKYASKELAGIEELESEEIAALKKRLSHEGAPGRRHRQDSLKGSTPSTPSLAKLRPGVARNRRPETSVQHVETGQIF